MRRGAAQWCPRRLPTNAERFARAVRDECKRLAPLLPEIDPLHVRRIIRNLMLPPAKRRVFIHRRNDGRYVF